MIRHQYEGKCGKVFDVLLDSSEVDVKVVACKCGDANCTTELSFNWGKMNIKAGEQTFAVRYFKNNQTGELIVASTPWSRAPMGFETCETKSFREVQKLEKALNDYAITSTTEAREAAHWEHQEVSSLTAREVGSMTPHSISEEAAVLHNQYVEEAGQARDYTPSIPDPLKRAEKALEVAKSHVAAQPHKPFTAIDPGIHFDVLN